MKKLLIVLVMCFVCISIFAQHEFFIRNVMVSVKNYSEIDGIPSKTPTVYIRGSFENDNGYLIDSGEIQITRNITFNNNSLLKDSGEFVLLGGKTGTINSFNSYEQIINGNFTNAFVGGNAFHAIIIDKPNWTNLNNSRISLGKNIEITQYFTWESGGIVTTDLVSHTDTGEAYQYEIYLKNPDPSSLSGYATTPGATNNYVVGKLRRQVDRIGDYYIPIGVEPDHGIGGMNACKVSFTSTPTNAGILAYLQKNGLQSILNPVLYGDIGTDPGSSGGDFSTCIGGPDGILDRMIISKNQNYQWNMSSNITGVFHYDIEVMPTNNCAISGVGDNVPAACITPYTGRSMTWLARGGVPLGTPTILINPTPLFSGLGYAVVPPVNYKIITDQVGFSTFRLHGATIFETVLPVELISFNLFVIDNSYFKLDWKTVSEFNCKEFVLERSVDANNFNTITSISGHGTTSSEHYYYYYDYDVIKNTDYYYRLKQIDYDGSFHYSNIIRGILIDDKSVVIYPNPTNNILYSSVVFDYIEIINSLGNIMTVGYNNNYINVNNLSNGTYIVKIWYQKQFYYFKIIKL